MTVLQHFINKFEGETAREFMDNIEAHIQENYDLIAEWEADGVDELSIKCQLDYIDDIKGTHKLYKGIMTYNDLASFIAANNKKGETVLNVFNYIPFNKAHLEEIKKLVWEEWAETDEELEMVGNITTMKELRQLIVKEAIMGADFQVWNKHFVNCVTN